MPSSRRGQAHELGVRAAGAPPRAPPAASSGRAAASPSPESGAPTASTTSLERAQLGGHLLGGAGLEEERAQPNRRLGRAHLLEHRQLERALERHHAAVVHPQPPMLDRSRSTASARRSSATVSEMRKKPSPFGPYGAPGDTTTPDSSSTSSQNEAESCPAGTGAQT